MNEKRAERKARYVGGMASEDAARGFIAGIPVDTTKHHRFGARRCQRCGVSIIGRGERIQGRGPYCDECRRLMWLALVRVSNLGESYYLRTYGIGMGEYAGMFLDQNGCCAICDDRGESREGERSLAVDHDHETGRVRGLLCSRCNLAIGLMADIPSYLTKAARYLKR